MSFRKLPLWRTECFHAYTPSLYEIQEEEEEEEEEEACLAMAEFVQVPSVHYIQNTYVRVSLKFEEFTSLNCSTSFR